MENKEGKQLPIDGNFLIQNGYKEGPYLGQALKLAQELEHGGLSKTAILKELKNKLPKEVEKLKLRELPLKVSMAAKAVTAEEESNLEQSRIKMEELSLCPVVIGAALMPDTCPSGQEFGCIPVGGAIQVANAIIPAAHSADVCCSMYASFFKSSSSLGEIMNTLESSTHFGPFSRPMGEEKFHPILNEPIWDNPFLKGLEDCAHKYLQTQGDGNHFSYIGLLESPQELGNRLEKEGYYEEAKSLVEAGKDPLYVLVTHHGSRKLGAQIYKRGLECAIIETNKIAQNIPKSMVWLDANSDKGKSYWQALEYAQRWTAANHSLIHESLILGLKTKEILRINNAHNFVWKRGNTFYHGKGATPAWKDSHGRKKIGIIPLNMSASILITFGEDNTTYLSFSPHGAGRNRSRSQTLNQFRDKENKIDKDLIAKAIKEASRDIDLRWASKRADVSESPLGYKDAETVKAQLQEFNLARLGAKIKPKGCIMAGEFEPIWKKKKKDKQLDRTGKIDI